MGLHPIPVDMDIVQQLFTDYGGNSANGGDNFDPEQVKRFVEANRHNM